MIVHISENQTHALIGKDRLAYQRKLNPLEISLYKFGHGKL